MFQFWVELPCWVRSVCLLSLLCPARHFPRPKFVTCGYYAGPREGPWFSYSPRYLVAEIFCSWQPWNYSIVRICDCFKMLLLLFLKFCLCNFVVCCLREGGWDNINSYYLLFMKEEAKFILILGNACIYHSKHRLRRGIPSYEREVSFICSFLEVL